MVKYPALIDGEEGAYGVVFPDLVGCCAMGDTIDEAMLNAEDALRDYVVEMEKDGHEIAPPSRLGDVAVPPGNQLVSIPLAPSPARP